jgi:hypothetical protein
MTTTAITIVNALADAIAFAVVAPASQGSRGNNHRATRTFLAATSYSFHSNARPAVSIAVACSPTLLPLPMHFSTQLFAVIANLKYRSRGRR